MNAIYICFTSLTKMFKIKFKNLFSLQIRRYSISWKVEYSTYACG